jgi:hypothetical protein
MHARASAGSTGHGSRRARHKAIPLTSKKSAAAKNTAALCSLSQMSCGTALTIPASAAPAPRETRTAGSTQQTNVAELAKSAPNATATFRA